MKEITILSLRIVFLLSLLSGGVYIVQFWHWSAWWMAVPVIALFSGSRGR